MYESMIAISNRHLTPEGRTYLEQLAVVAQKAPRAIVLREKDLTEDAYEKLAQEVLKIGNTYQVPVILHNFHRVAVKLECRKIHLPLQRLREMDSAYREKYFEEIGTSVHSVEDAREAVRLGATYCFAGNIFETDCKKGLAGRGLHFLREVCEAVEIPVYAIGGINEERLPEVQRAGAAGGCMMSGVRRFNEA